MSLLSPPPEPSNKSKVWTFTIAALAVALAIVLYFSLRYYPEKKAAEHFLETFGELQAGRFSGGLGTRGLLRPGEKLFDRKSGVTQRREWRDLDHRGQPIFADAGQIRC